MSMYNMVHGVNPLTPILLASLGLKTDDTGRFRDVFYNYEDKTIIIYTRNGGGNRESYQHVFDTLSKHPQYIRDYDDDFDSTYAYIVFSVPERYKEMFKDIMPKDKTETVEEKFIRSIQKMKSMGVEEIKKDPRLGPLSQLFDKIIKDMDDPDRNKPGHKNIYKV